MVTTIQVSSLEEIYGSLKKFIAPGALPFVELPPGHLKRDTLKLPSVFAMPLVQW